MKHNFFKTIFTLIFVFSVLFTQNTPVSYAAHPYPIDTSSDGAQRIESLTNGTKPDAYFESSPTTCSEVVEDGPTGNKYIRLTATNVSGNKTQALMQHVKPAFGLLEFEVDFRVEDTNSTLMLVGYIESTVSKEQNLSLIQFSYDTSKKTTAIKTNYWKKGATAATAVTIADSWETKKWYHLRAVLNPKEGTYSLSLKKEGDSTEITKLITDAQPYTVNWKSLQMKIPSYAVYTSDTTSKMLVDNMKIKTLDYLAIDSAVPSDSEVITPSQEIKFELTDSIDGAAQVFIDDVEILSSAMDISSDGCTYSYTPPLPFEWESAHTLKIKAKDMSGAVYSFASIDFNVMEQPQNLIEVLGFYDSDGNKLPELKAASSGEITSKLRFWQKSAQDYTYVVGLYAKKGAAVKMISASCGTFNASEKTDKDIPITVPSGLSDCYIRVFVFDTLSNRNIFYGSSVSGSTILQ